MLFSFFRYFQYEIWIFISSWLILQQTRCILIGRLQVGVDNNRAKHNVS